MARIFGRRFEELSKQAELLEATKKRGTGEYGDSYSVESDALLNWKTKARHLIVSVCGNDSEHLSLFLESEEAKMFDTNYKMLPPLRSRSDREALLGGLLDGTLDMLATAHAPHTEFEKNLDFQNAPFGIIGLETALPALFDGLIQSGRLPWRVLVRAFCQAPRRLLGLPDNPIQPGEPADFIRFDPRGKTTVTREWLLSRSHNSPWLGRTLAGAVIP